MGKPILMILIFFSLFNTVGFIFMGGIIDVLYGVIKGEGRIFLCGTNGCSDWEYILSLGWLIGQSIIVFILPIVLIVYIVRSKLRKLKE